MFQTWDLPLITWDVTMHMGAFPSEMLREITYLNDSFHHQHNFNDFVDYINVCIICNVSNVILILKYIVSE